MNPPHLRLLNRGETMKVRILAAVAALALGTAIGGAANATTYLLTTSDVAAFQGNGPYGQVTVTGTATDLHFDVQMFGSYQIIDTGSHFAFTGDVTGTINSLSLPSSEYHLAGSPPTSQPDFTLTKGSISNSPFSGFDFGLNCTSCGPGSNNPFGQHLIFDLLGTGLSVQQASTHNNTPIFFAADVTDANGNTGTVGGGPLGGIPEPATWGLMIAGFGAVGAAMRRNRAAALTVA
jgi:hypothetical protein